MENFSISIEFFICGGLIFPADKGYYSGSTLGNLSLTWYNNIDPNKTVEICNYMMEKASAGDRIFYDIYTDEEKANDPEKVDMGTYGPGYFGGADLPKPGTVVMQYTGHTEYGRNDPPTYACVGTNDSIADWRTMQSRLEAMSALGIPTEFHVYEGLRHGFGLGTGTVAEGWIDDAVSFWENR